VRGVRSGPGDAASAALAVAALVVAAVLPLTPALARMDPTQATLATLHAVVCAVGAGLAVHRRCRPCLLVASAFPYCWLVVPSVFQIDRVQAAWGDPGVTLDFSATLRAQGVLLVAQVVFLAAYLAVGVATRRVRRARTHPAYPTDPDPETVRLDATGRRRVATLACCYLLAAVALAPVLLSYAGGLGALTTSREEVVTALQGNGLSRDDNAAGSLVRLAPSSFAVAAGVLGVWLARASGGATGVGRGARAGGVALVVGSLLVLGLVANPLVSPRYLVLATFGAVALAVLRPRGRRGAVAMLVVAVVGFLLAYPAADYFRYGRLRAAGVPALAGQDFDGFQQVVNTVSYVDAQGFDGGLHLLSGLLFFVPRSLWETKTQPTTFDVAGARGYDFLDLSTPLPAEAHLALGWVGVVVLLGLVGVAWALLDRAWPTRSCWAVLAAYVAVAQVGLWRGPFGSLSGIFGSTVLLLGFALLVTARVRPGARTTSPEPRTQPRTPPYPRPASARRWPDAALAVGGLLALVLAVVALLPPGDTEAAAGPVTTAPVTAAADAGPEVDPDATLAEGLIRGRIGQALSADEVPSDLDPAVADLGPAQWYDGARRAGCVSVDPADSADTARCLFGPPDAPTTTVLLGDTAAVGYVPAVRGALATGLVQQLTLPGCPPLVLATDRLTGGPFGQCDRFKADALATIDRLEPDLVLISTTSAYARRGLSSGATGADALAEIADGLTREIEEVSAPGRLVAVIAEPPGSGDLSVCASPGASAAGCVGSADETRAFADMERTTAEAAGAAYVDTEAWFCADGRCPAFVGTTPVYADGTRLTQAYSRELTDVMRDALIEVVAAR